MGSPGVFIHCGTLGGRFSAFSVAADALLPARPPATTAPPTSAPPSRRNRRRDVATRCFPVSVGSVIAGTPLETGTPGITQRSSVISQEEDDLIIAHRARRRLPRVAVPVPFLPIQCRREQRRPTRSLQNRAHGKGRIVADAAFAIYSGPFQPLHLILRARSLA